MPQKCEIYVIIKPSFKKGQTMKKIIIAALAVVLVLVAYLAQVAYMGKLNQQFFEQNIKPNDFVSFENVEFKKGFFTSKASFEGRIKAESYQLASSAEFGEWLTFSVDMELKNNALAKDNVIIKVQSPVFAAFQEIFSGLEMDFNENLLDIRAGVSLFGKVSVRTKIADIDFKEGENSFKLVGASGQSELDLSGKMLKSSAEIKDFTFVDASGYAPISFTMSDLAYEEDYGKGVSIMEYFAGAAVADGKGSVRSVKVDDISLSELAFTWQSAKTQNQSLPEAGEMLASKVNISIKSVESPMMQINLDDIKGEFEIENESMEFVQAFYAGEFGAILPDDMLQIFFATQPVVKFSNTFNSKGKKFSSNGDLQGTSSNYAFRYNAQSEAKLSEIFPPFMFIGIDNFFVQNGDNYSLDFKFESDFNLSKMSVNGEEINFNSDKIIFDDEGEKKNNPKNPMLP